MIVELNKQKFAVNSNEFNLIKTSEEFCNLKLYDNLGLFERIISLIKELSIINEKKFINLFFNQTHGGFVPLKCASFIDEVFIFNTDKNNTDTNINANILTYKIENIKFVTNLDVLYDNIKEHNIIIFSEKYEFIDESIIKNYNPIILTSKNNNNDLPNYHIFKLSNTKYLLFVPNLFYDDFYKNFYYFIENSNTLNYDNLIHLCVMVKNGGNIFEKMLLENINLIDRWTILDTGSTDNTIDIINKVLVGKKKGELFREPFINFRDSRNHLLELAGKICKFALMLDDSYIVKGDLRLFLNKIRSDQFSDSCSLQIQSDDVEYSSNRIIKTNNELKYIYKVHEIIQDYNNVNILIPKNFAYIIDETSDYMLLRTLNRKQQDLQLLFEELEDNPNNSRIYYYLAQTYNVMKNYEKAYHFFIERMNHPNEGYIQEKIDAIFEAARIANFKLNKPWEVCEELYLKAYSLDNTRPDALYFVGIYYYCNDKKPIAFNYFKHAFNLGYPSHSQYSLKPKITFYFLPKLLVELCYVFCDFKLGENCTKIFLENNNPQVDDYNIMISWYNIFIKLNTVNLKLDVSIIKNEKKPLLCFVADGGFEPWTGSDILTKGIGGSETYIIEMAHYIQKNGYFKVIVFCNCIEQSIFENVEYMPIKYFGAFVKSTYIHTCIISRFIEYIPLAIKNQTKNVYLVLHDLINNGVIIPIDSKLKNIFCLSEWHLKHFVSIFPEFESITVPFYNGIDIFKFDTENKLTNDYYVSNDLVGQNIQIDIFEVTQKIPFKFIYSSFPNRGLFELLKMWINIVIRYPKATLHIYSDIDGKWVNDVVPDLMKEIKKILKFYESNSKYNVYYHGWVNKDTLAEAWKTSEYWFYPCTFEETFCITALEAAISKTLAITNGLAALQNTVDKRGICVEGDARTDEWKKKALDQLFLIMENKDKKAELIKLNYEWASKLSWENQANKLVNNYLLYN
jgi:hypothetical protein